MASSGLVLVCSDSDTIADRRALRVQLIRRAQLRTFRGHRCGLSHGHRQLARSKSLESKSVTWAEIRKPLIASIAEKKLEATYESLVGAAWDAEGGLDAWSGLQLIRWWWWSTRSKRTAGAAAGWLRAWIRHELEMGEEYYAEGADAAPAGVKRTEYERRAALLSKLSSDEAFAAAVVVEMASYDPREERRSPYHALSTILDKRLTRILGGAPGPRRPKQTDFGDELKRLFLLPTDDPSRKRLDWCLPKLAPDERELFELRYRDDVKHDAVRDLKKWSGPKIDAVRKSAVSKLCDCMPSLHVFTTPSRKN
jgi:hypothetical protein